MKIRKRVAIITLPLGENYGGILQAYSLQKIVHNLGMNVVTASIPKQNSLKLLANRVIKTVLHIVKSSVSNLTSKDILIKTEKTRQFVNIYI